MVTHFFRCCCCCCTFLYALIASAFMFVGCRKVVHVKFGLFFCPIETNYKEKTIKKLTHLLFIDTYRFQAKWTQDFLRKHFFGKTYWYTGKQKAPTITFFAIFFSNTYSCCFVNFLVVRGLANFIIFTFSEAIWTNFCWNISLYR